VTIQSQYTAIVYYLLDCVGSSASCLLAHTAGSVVPSEVNSHGSSPTGDIFLFSFFAKFHFQPNSTYVLGSVRVMV